MAIASKYDEEAAETTAYKTAAETKDGIPQIDPLEVKPFTGVPPGGFVSEKPTSPTMNTTPSTPSTPTTAPSTAPDTVAGYPATPTAADSAADKRANLWWWKEMAVGAGWLLWIIFSIVFMFLAYGKKKA